MSEMSIPIYGLQGKVLAYALVDSSDFEWLKSKRWTISHGYARTYMNNTTVSMHRMILDPPENLLVDHINRDKLDNRRSNLRTCTPLENTRNRMRRSKLGYKGVSGGGKHNPRKYRASIRVNRKQIHLGYFDTTLEAAKAYDLVALREHGEFACINGV